MGVGEKLRSAAETLITASDALRRAASSQPALAGAGRAFGRIAEAANRPLRIGILGETNAGKSSLANLLVGIAVLPAHPVRNTQLPTLLKYASAPSVSVLYENGKRTPLPQKESIPQTLADLYESGGTLPTQGRNDVSRGAMKRLEVGLPSEILRSVEILDLPGSADALSATSNVDTAHHDMDAAIWATVATQAWRASEQTRWLELPEAVRSRGLLVVTYCDMVAGGKKDLKKLRARLEASAMPHFRGLCFVDARDGKSAVAASENELLFALLQYLAQEFSAKRLDKALAIAQRTMKRAVGKLGSDKDDTALAAQGGEHTAAQDTAGEEIAELKTFLNDWPASDFAEEARAQFKKPPGPLATRRGVLIGAGAGAMIVVAGGAAAILYTGREAPDAATSRPFVNNQPILSLTGHAAWIHSAAFSPDGRTILSGSGDNVLKLWDAATGKELRSFTGFPDSVRSAAFSPDGRTILCGGNANALILVDAGTGEALRTFKGHSDGIPSVAFSPDGRSALSGSWDKTLRLWDVGNGAELRVFRGHTDEINVVAFSPEGKTVLSGSRDRTLRLWSTETGRALRTYRGHTDWISAAVFSPRGRTILSSSTDNTLRLWDVASGEQLHSYPGQAPDFSPVAFSPDGRTILSGGYATLKLWDVITTKELGTFAGHEGGVTSVAFSPDGRVAVSGGMDKTLKLWDMTPGQPLSARR